MAILYADNLLCRFVVTNFELATKVNVALCFQQCIESFLFLQNKLNGLTFTQKSANNSSWMVSITPIPCYEFEKKIQQLGISFQASNINKPFFNHTH